VVEIAMTQDTLNHRVWSETVTVREYAGSEGLLEPGERAIFERVVASLHDKPILDLGVGAGRTVPLLRPLASRYVALDYEPSMVSACRQRFPDVDVQIGDARDLSRFADETFGLVTFSFNGLDAIDHEGRARVLSEVHRVLRRGGLFWFSTLNIDGVGRRMRPWKPEWPARDGHPFRYAARTLQMLARIPKRMRNRARLKPEFVKGDGWCIETLSAHDYRLLVHYTSLARELAELAEAGFASDPLVVDCSSGRPLAVVDDQRDVFWYQILAQK
jgi:SAM-dependent methyltransferase